MPAEFEQQAAVWMGWPTFQWYSGSDMDTRIPLANIIQILADAGVVVRIMCTDKAGEDAVRNWFSVHGYLMSAHIEFVHIPQIDIWQRDFGPIFLRNASGQLGMASFLQNQWGYSQTTNPTSAAMAKVPQLVAQHLKINLNINAAIVSEGGNRIINGRGVLLVGRAVELQRNPTATHSQMETAYQQALGVTKIIWLDHGVYEDLHSDWGPIPYNSKDGNCIFLYGPQTTGGHLDEFVRFAGPNTIILAGVTEEEAATNPLAAVNYARLEGAYRILATAKDQSGKPFEIIRLPVPDIEYQQIEPGERMYDWLAALRYPPNVPPFPKGHSIYVVKPSSYANYFVANTVVVAPAYNNPQKDEEAAGVLAAAYNGRKVRQIDPTALNYAGGGIHCCTQQQPAGNP